MAKLAVIGGTGLTEIPELERVATHRISTAYGEPSADIIEANLNGQEVYFLPRHGEQHSIAPHRINYRANIAALHQLGVTDIIAIAAVGGIAPMLNPGRLVCPDQIIDYTYGREQTFYSANFSPEQHIDFTYPYTQALRQQLLTAASEMGLSMEADGVYGTTQGPRLETAAEIRRMAQDGCTIVGMTGMPEAALARELAINYACCALVVNWAAGINGEQIEMAAIEQVLEHGMSELKQLLFKAITLYQSASV